MSTFSGEHHTTILSGSAFKCKGGPFRGDLQLGALARSTGKG
jgi:hypothetical protein